MIKTFCLRIRKIQRGSCFGCFQQFAGQVMILLHIFAPERIWKGYRVLIFLRKESLAKTSNTNNCCPKVNLKCTSSYVNFKFEFIKNLRMTRDLLATMQIVGMYLPKTENCVVENLFMNYMINLSNKQKKIQKVKIFYNICM